MPKTRRDRSVSFERPRKSTAPCSSSVTQPKTSPPSEDDLKEWEDARCPVCMEHPHNAVLLVCSAYDKGCRPYMCDTSYRHSNCLDQFRKSFVEGPAETPSEGAGPTESPSEGLGPTEIMTTVESIETLVTSQEEGKSQSQGSVVAEIGSMHKLQQKLVCPLCRGQISGWVVVDLARDFMNSKTRTCASETCEFSGNYSDLRKHARSDHPQVRPSEADPERQRSWRRLERQRDIGDVLSTIQSTLGDDQDDLPMDERGWITIFFLFRVWQPSPSSRSSSWSGTSRARTRGQLRSRRSERHWGEGYDADRASALRASPERASGSIDHDDSSDDGSVTMRRRVRRRLSTPDDEA